MKRINVFQIILELIVIFGFLVVGVTILTYLFQRVAVDRIVLGLIIMATGIFGLVEYFSLKYVFRIRSIPALVASGAAVVLGTLFLFLKIEIKQLCLIWAWCNIGFAVAKITTSVLLLLRQPLLNGIRIIIQITAIVLSIFLMIKTVDYLNSFLLFLGIAFLVEAAALLIEFIIHRYQN